MKQNAFTLLQVNESLFNMNFDDNEMNDDMKKRLSVAFLFVLQYQNGNEASALQAVVRIMLDDKVILENGATLIFKSKIWDNMSHDEETVRKSDFAKIIVGYALPFISGMLSIKVQDTKLNGLFLPAINPSELVSNIKVENMDKKQSALNNPEIS